LFDPLATFNGITRRPLISFLFVNIAMFLRGAFRIALLRAFIVSSVGFFTSQTLSKTSYTTTLLNHCVTLFISRISGHCQVHRL